MLDDLAERPSSSELFLSQHGRPLTPSHWPCPNKRGSPPTWHPSNLPILHSLSCSSALWTPGQACRLLHRPWYTRFPGLSVRCGMNGRLGSRASRPSRIWSGRTDQPEAFRERTCPVQPSEGHHQRDPGPYQVRSVSICCGERGGGESGEALPVSTVPVAHQLA